MVHCVRMFRILLIVGLLVAVLAYQLYEPMPSYVQDRALVTFIQAASHAMEGIGRVTELLGLISTEALRRVVIGAVVPSAGNTSSVRMTHRQFARSRTLVAQPARSDGAAAAAAVIYIHGGGWVFGAPEYNLNMISELVEVTGVTVYAVRYRLAPEHKFPAAFDDCLAAAEAIFASAEASGVDPSRIAVAGDSAGGQLAASVVQQLLRGGGRFRPKLQVLLFPVTQVVNFRTESYRTQLNAPILKYLHMPGFISLHLTGSNAAAGWLHDHGHVTDRVRAVYERATGETLPNFDPAPASGDGDGVSASVATQVAALATDFRVSPLLGDDLEKLGLPPAHILACEFDPLFDDSVLYARRLERSGVRTHLRRFRTFHGAVGMPTDGRELRQHLARIIMEEL